MSNSALTKRIKALLVGSIAVTLVAVAGAQIWMADQHNQQAAGDSQQMIVGGVEAMRDTLHTLTMEYAWWEDAFNAIWARDGQWLAENIGSGAYLTQAADILVLVQPDLSVQYAWQNGMDEEPDPSILDRVVIDEMIGLLASVPTDTVVARSGIFDRGDHVIMLSVARVSPDEPSLVNPADFPIVIMGYFLTPLRVSQIGEAFLIDDLALSHTPVQGAMGLALLGLDGEELTHLYWTPVQPGSALLTKVAAPIGVALAIFALLGFGVALRAQKAANQLAESEREANVAARVDSMTGLANRLRFSEELDSPEVQRAADAGELAVVFADVNDFKIVNDTVGHTRGDRLIKALADRLRSDLGGDALLARVGGDEFNVLIIDSSAGAAAESVAKRMVGAFEHVFHVDGASFHITAAIGFATSEGGVEDPMEVVRRADVAMYKAKEHRTRAPIAYEAEFESGAARKREIEVALRIGMEGGELKVFYQPIVDSGSYRMTGSEALLRWHSAELGSVSPADFIPVAEETGMIVDIGRLVLKQVCSDMAQWPSLKVSVNVSPVELREPSFVDDAIATVGAVGIDPSRIGFELTENILVSHPELARVKLDQLKAAGFTIALDDFGTGFSSIGYLRQLPFDRLKIDCSFVSKVGENDKANGLLQSLIKLGEALDLEVVSEGVENETQANLMHLAGSGSLQGHFFNEPMPISELRCEYGPDQASEMTAA